MERLDPDLLRRAMNPPSKDAIGAYEKSLQAKAERQRLIRQEIIKMYVSARKELPEDTTLDAETLIAMEDWSEIPSKEISSLCAEARKRSAGFLPGNGAVVKIHRERKAEFAERPWNFKPKGLALESPDRAPAHPDEVKQFLEETYAKMPWLRGEEEVPGRPAQRGGIRAGDGVLDGEPPGSQTGATHGAPADPQKEEGEKCEPQ